MANRVVNAIDDTTRPTLRILERGWTSWNEGCSPNALLFMTPISHPACDRPKRERNRPDPIRVLVVDDEVSIRTILKHALSEAPSWTTLATQMNLPRTPC